MSLGQSIRTGIQWTLGGNIGLQVLGFIFGIVLARILAPADFGILVTIQIYTGLAGFVAGGGMGQALVRIKKISPSDFNTVFTLQLIIGCMIYCFFFFFAPILAYWYDTPTYTELIRVSALSFILRPFNNVPANLLHRQMRFKAKAFVSIVSRFVSGGSSIGFAVFGFGVWSLVYGGLASSISSIILSIILTRWSPKLKLDLTRGRELASYGLLVSANDIVLYLRKQTSNFVIGRLITPAAVGLYNKGDSLSVIPASLVSSSAYNVVFRALATVQHNTDQSKYIYLRTITLVTVYMLPIYICAWWLAELFIEIVYGEKWIEAAPILQILCLAAVFRCIDEQSGAVCAARNLLGKELWVQITGFVFLLAGSYVGYRWGIQGIAWAAVGTWCITAGLMARIACKELQVSGQEFLKSLVPAAMLNSILIFSLWLTHAMIYSSTHEPHPYLSTIIPISIGMMLYVFFFLFFPPNQIKNEALRWKQQLRLATHLLHKKTSTP